MNEIAIDRLIGSSEALIAALDAHDIDAIEAALPVFGQSVADMTAAGGGLPSPGLTTRLKKALELADAARARVRYLGDRTRQRIDLLAAAAGRFDITPATYGRHGR